MSQQQQGMQNMMQDPSQQDMSGNYYPQESDLTGGLPINLDSLRDGPPGSKPFYPYSTLIRYVAKCLRPCNPRRLGVTHCTYRYAIKGAPSQKLLLEDIYYAIESRVSLSARMLDLPILTCILSFHTSGPLPTVGR